ncbi:MAG TPA: alginate export family protein, partial [Terriglobales bacterium]|nr:alginate export family protein [Terriglobales bacterium]
DCQTDSLDLLKFIPVGEQAYVSLGGEARLRYERYSNPGFGTDPKTDSGYLLQRYLFHSDIHFTPTARLFIQFQSGIENGRNGGPRPTDEDIAEFHQAFLDLPIGHFRDSPIIVRVGKQEIEFGSGRMVGAAEGLNIRRSFDGLRFHYAQGKWSFNSTLLRPVALDRGAFDDIPDHNQTLWGIGSTRKTKVGGASLYYFGFDRKSLRLNTVVGRDLRHSIGTRWWGARGRWDFNDEYFLQFGSFAHRRLLAGAGSFDLGWTFSSLRLRPRIGIRADATSGGVGTGVSDSVHTFIPLFPNPSYASRNALISPANLWQVSPTLRTTLGKFTATVDSPFSWRSSTSDGIYNFASILVRPGNRTSARYVGTQPGGQIDFRASLHWTATLQYSHFFSGEFLKKTSPGKDVDYFVLSTTYRF